MSPRSMASATGGDGEHNQGVAGDLLSELRGTYHLISPNSNGPLSKRSLNSIAWVYLQAQELVRFTIHQTRSKEGFTRSFCFDLLYLVGISLLSGNISRRLPLSIVRTTTITNFLCPDEWLDQSIIMYGLLAKIGTWKCKRNWWKFCDAWYSGGCLLMTFWPKFPQGNSTKHEMK